MEESGTLKWASILIVVRHQDFMVDIHCPDVSNYLADPGKYGTIMRSCKHVSVMNNSELKLFEWRLKTSSLDFIFCYKVATIYGNVRPIIEF